MVITTIQPAERKNSQRCAHLGPREGMRRNYVTSTPRQSASAKTRLESEEAHDFDAGPRRAYSAALFFVSFSFFSF